ncbi:carboxypeptidase-like regulatory domain-containing protein, partial [Maribacter sp.]|nr:carboxypeptidase-like regulatory domain-containing protein [Maribacter sp.]
MTLFISKNTILIVLFRMLKFLCCFGFLMNTLLVFCQQREFVTGRLTDKQTQEPVPFASIRLKSKAIGLISNFDGEFKIPLDFKKVGDTLLISCIGYRTKEVVLSNLFENQMNTISLVTDVEKLREVVVTTARKKKRLTAREIMRLALSKIPENYPTTLFSYVGYYRDYQLKEGAYLNLNEAILGIFDLGFATKDFKNTKVRLYKYGENQNFIRDSISSQTYDYSNRRKIIPNATISGRIRNEYTRLRLHDAIRNHDIYTYSFVDRLDMDLIKNHKLRLEEDTFINEVPLYKIKISKAIDKINIIGHIYIDKANFSIYKLEYAVHEKKPLKYRKEPFSNNRFLNKEKGKLLYDITVEYQRHQDKMYLNYISFSNAFDILPPPKFTPVSAKINSDKGRFELVLNNPPLEKDALNPKNYNLYYQERKLSIATIKVNKNSVFLYPKNAKVVFDKKLVRYFKERNTTGVAIEIKNVRDIYGNIVNESQAERYDQFREF